MQGTLHPRRIAAGDIEASCSSDWPIPSAHPSFHSTMGLFGALEWPSLGGPRGEKVWEAALRSRTSEPPRHSQS